MSYAIAARVELPAEEKQRMLELRSERGRLEVVMEILERGLERIAGRRHPEVAQTNGKSSLHR